MYGHQTQTTHVAAQYGQTAFLHHVVSKWNADPDVSDNDGRSPLHWAAYKGFADCIRLLLFLDAYRGQQHKEGSTPLHWAATRGNFEACTVSVQAGKKEYLIATDNTGLTPAQLASDKNHRQVAFFLLSWRGRNSLMKSMMKARRRQGPAAQSRSTVSAEEEASRRRGGRTGSAARRKSRWKNQIGGGRRQWRRSASCDADRRKKKEGGGRRRRRKKKTATANGDC